MAPSTSQLAQPSRSRWTVTIPSISVPEMIFQSATGYLPRCLLYVDAAAPDTFQVTFHSLREWSKRLAGGLRQRGLQKGDRVLLVSRNTIFLPIIIMGIMMAGGIYVPANPRSVPRELLTQMQDATPRFVLTEEAFVNTVLSVLESDQVQSLGRDDIFVLQRSFDESKGQAAPEGFKHWFSILLPIEEAASFDWKTVENPVGPDDTAMLLYSSGTTGLPKGVEVTHFNLVANALQMSHMWDLDPRNRDPQMQTQEYQSRWLCCLPMYHGLATVVYLTVAPLRRTPTYIMRDYEINNMLRYIQEFRVTNLFMVPPILVAMSKNTEARRGHFDLNSVREVICGAAPLGREQAATLEQLWPKGHVNVKQAFGMTEMSGLPIMWDPTLYSDSAAVGELVPNCEAKIMNEDGLRALPDGQRGELWCRGPSMMKGYWNNPTATKNTIAEGGWLKTGDIAIRDAEGRYYIVDRKKEFIKVKGVQVAPAELEALLLEHPQIRDAAVVGVKMEDTEVPRAYIVRRQDSTVSVQDILDFMAPKTSKIKRLQGGIRFVDTIPRNPSGKILRNVLRARVATERNSAIVQAKI